MRRSHNQCLVLRGGDTMSMRMRNQSPPTVAANASQTMVVVTTKTAVAVATATASCSGALRARWWRPVRNGMISPIQMSLSYFGPCDPPPSRLGRGLRQRVAAGPWQHGLVCCMPQRLANRSCG